MSDVVKQISGLPFRFGGEPHSGWLPAGAAIPLPTPIREVVLDLEILREGPGYLLCYSSRDGTVFADTWHQSIEEAERSAAAQFGVHSSQWQTP